MKAGILEIADILAVNKCDLPLAGVTLRHLQMMLHLRKSSARDVPLIATGALKGTGIVGPVDAVLRHGEKVSPGSGRRKERRAEINDLLQEAVGRRVGGLLAGSVDPAVARLCDNLASGAVDIDEAVRRLLGIAAG